VSLTELKHWEMAPFNPALLHKSGIQFAFTSRGLKSPDLLFEAVRKAIDAGLPEQEALKALTTLPAEMVGIGHLVGSIEVGKVANILVSDQPIFDESARLFEHWVQGERFVLIDQSTPDLSGHYDVRMQGQLMLMEVSGKPGKHQTRLRIATLKADSSGVMQPDTLDVPAKLQQEGTILTLAIGPKENFVDGVWRFSGYVKGDQWELQGEDREGTHVELRASKTQPLTNKEREKKARQSLEKGDIIYPFMAYGWTKQPVQETLWIRHATLWTCEAEGVIEDGELLVSGGKILAVGKQIDPKKILGKQGGVVKEIDATGMHISPGIIDEHSHIAISRGVNEWTETSSAEVSIGSVVDSEDIDIYRQLSGGVTAAQLLHGSANPIGGQSAIIKLRWGLSPGEMLIEGAAPFIKFALGENVKQSNSGEDYTSRFPQTRMGVEQVYYDMFIRALEYEQEWDEYEALLKDKKRASTAVPPRKDLELEVLLQILKKERFISCHSYRQDEINMLMHVADSLGFTLNTFTHILEGYKVADKMAEHGAGASSFSDWWAYKYEVKDAIPYNGAILWEHGITTAFNSDDAEMARRLNQEAAKAVKYGGVPEEEALKFVTLNPAKLLHLDARMGSLKAGKDADFVIWNAPPLSIYAVVQQTYVDGRCYFDRNVDSELRASIRAERARLIQKMLDEPAEGKEKPKEKVKHRYHCDSATEELR
jgi:imidazolonepropionase-like amidohydrolase